MSGIVLVVGLAMAVAGVYEMFAGYSDILSERGWSAFIAGAVLLSGGVVTMALGMAVRAVDRLRAAIFLDPLAVRDATAHAEERMLGSSAAATPVMTQVEQADLFHEPTFEQAPTAPVLAAAPIEHALAHESYPAAEAPPPPHVEPEPQPEPPKLAEAEPRHDDWLDHSFSELEREMAARHGPAETAAAPHLEQVAAVAELEPATTTEPAAVEPHPLHEPHPVHEPHFVDEDLPVGVAAHDRAAPVAAPADQATVSAREAPATSAVIGRYESEGTSYVMYADGSIDAQSEAGVYRFASMAELKSFIES